VLPHIKKLDDCFGQFLVRVISDCGVPRDRAGSPRTPSRLEDDAQGAGATDALLEVREKGCGGHGGCETQAAWDPYRIATSRAGRKLAVVNSLCRAILRLVAVEPSAIWHTNLVE